MERPPVDSDTSEGRISARRRGCAALATVVACCVPFLALIPAATARPTHSSQAADSAPQPTQAPALPVPSQVPAVPTPTQTPVLPRSRHRDRAEGCCAAEAIQGSQTPGTGASPAAASAPAESGLPVSRRGAAQSVPAGGP